ncbi:MAG: endonuclease [Bacteriovoracaceae bacterium]|nr:endonuclease [Bacteriovoracaceae bacterium]
MQKLMLSIIALGISSTGICSSGSYYPNEYRNSFESSALQNIELKKQLFKVLTAFHQPVKRSADILAKRCEFNDPTMGKCYQQISLEYKDARKQLFGFLHLKEDDQGIYLEDLYCNRKMRENDYSDQSTIGKFKVPTSSVTNCEHTWPQSRFSKNFSKRLQKSDLHHLFPTDSKANSKRANYPFAEVSGKPVSASCTASKVGSILQATQKSRSKRYFEPPKYHKGNVARALFYFSVRYKIPINPNEEYYLKKWHMEDPVDADELERNDRIESIQYNRNPFIDFPQLVDQISDF